MLKFGLKIICTPQVYMRGTHLRCTNTAFRRGSEEKCRCRQTHFSFNVMVAVALVAAESSFLRDSAIAHSILPRPSVSLSVVSPLSSIVTHIHPRRVESVSCSFVRYAWKCERRRQ